MTERFIDDGFGNIKAIETVDLEWAKDEATGRYNFKKIPGSEKEWPCDLLLIAAGFLHPQREGMIEQLGLELDQRGNVKSNGYQTSVDKVFAAGDMRRGQSLVVWAISEGREAAKAVDEYLMGHSSLEGKDDSFLITEEEAVS